MRLLEVVRGKATAPDVLATTLKLGKTLRKMSPKGHGAALALDLPEAKRALIMKAVAREADTLAKLAAVAID